MRVPGSGGAAERGSGAGIGTVAVSERQFDDKARSGGGVVLDADRTAVVLDDFGDDRQTEARAALAGGEPGEKQALAHVVGDAGPGVGDDDLGHALALTK